MITNPRVRFTFYKTISVYLLVLSFAQCTFASEYDADISFIGKNITLYDFERIIIPVTVKNTGSQKWDSFALEFEVSEFNEINSSKEKQRLSKNFLIG